MKILGISGSLRKNSFSGMLLNAASKLAPEGVEFEIADISQVPMFNQDEEMNMPAAVAALKAKVEAADALVIVTPEYNYSFSGVIKNAIDWVSRPYGQSSFKAKPTVFMASSIWTIRRHSRVVPAAAGGTWLWWHDHAEPSAGSRANHSREV